MSKVRIFEVFTDVSAFKNGATHGGTGRGATPPPTERYEQCQKR